MANFTNIWNGINQIYTGTDGIDIVDASGDGNSISGGDGDDSILVTGDGNFVDGGSGADQVLVRGDYNTLVVSDEFEFIDAVGNNNILQGYGSFSEDNPYAFQMMDAVGDNNTLNASDMKTYMSAR